MKVMVNAVSNKEGGSRVVLVKLLTAICAQRPDLAVCLAAPPHICKELAGAAITTWPVDVGQSPLAVLKWYEFDLFSASRRWRADVVFSLTNFLPRRQFPLPTLLLMQQAGYFSPDFDRLTREASVSLSSRILWDQKKRWVRRSLAAATAVTVQTAALADAMTASAGLSGKSILVIPHGPGWVENVRSVRTGSTAAAVRIGYVTKWGVQKNFVILFRAVAALAREGCPVKLVLTLDPAYPPAAATLDLAATMGIAGLIENHGEVKQEDIQALYDSLDVFVFPSLCESFGLPMVEAMARSLPIVVADTPENREITGSAGLIFPPGDAESLTGILRTLSADKAARDAYAKLSYTRARQFSWEKAAEATAAALELAAGARTAKS